MKKFTDGLLAGLMISLGGAAFLGCYNESRIAGAALFAVGLLAVCIMGYNLFTGKVGYMIEDHSLEAFGVLFIGLLGNAIASIAMGYLVAYVVPDLGVTAEKICLSKLAQDYLATIFRGVLCGILIYLAVDIYKKHKSVLGIIFGVPAFILSGYEHSIADIFYFAASGIASLEAFLYILAVILGNAVGGLLIPAIGLLNKIKFRKKQPSSPEQLPQNPDASPAPSDETDNI